MFYVLLHFMSVMVLVCRCCTSQCWLFPAGWRLVHQQWRHCVICFSFLLWFDYISLVLCCFGFETLGIWMATDFHSSCLILLLSITWAIKLLLLLQFMLYITTALVSGRMVGIGSHVYVCYCCCIATALFHRCIAVMNWHQIAIIKGAMLCPS